MNENKIDLIVENVENKLKHSLTSLYNYDDEIEFIDDVDEFVIDELLDELDIKFKYTYKNDDEKNYVIKIDPIVEKNEIENYDELIEIINDINNDLDYLRYNLNDENIYENDILYDNIKKIFDNYLINNKLELYDDIYEFIDVYDNYYINQFKNYDVEIDNINYIVVNNKYKIIKNYDIDEIIEIVKNKIVDELELNNKVNYNKIVQIFNLINKYDKKIYDDPIDEIYDKIYYDIFDNDIDELNKFKDQILNNYDDEIEFIYVNNITSNNKLYLEIIKYENIDEIFNDDIVNDIINYISSIYYYYYDEINKLNELLDDPIIKK